VAGLGGTIVLLGSRFLCALVWGARGGERMIGWL